MEDIKFPLAILLEEISTFASVLKTKAVSAREVQE